MQSNMFGWTGDNIDLLETWRETRSSPNCKGFENWGNCRFL